MARGDTEIRTGHLLYVLANTEDSQAREVLSGLGVDALAIGSHLAGGGAGTLGSTPLSANLRSVLLTCDSVAAGRSGHAASVDFLGAMVWLPECGAISILGSLGVSADALGRALEPYGWTRPQTASLEMKPV